MLGGLAADNTFCFVPLSSANLAEMSDEMHEFVYGKLGPRHASAISELIAIMMLEEELLMLRHQIQACVDGNASFVERDALESVAIDIAEQPQQELPQEEGVAESKLDVQPPTSTLSQPAPAADQAAGGPETTSVIQPAQKAVVQQVESCFEEVSTRTNAMLPP